MIKAHDYDVPPFVRPSVLRGFACYACNSWFSSALFRRVSSQARPSSLRRAKGECERRASLAVTTSYRIIPTTRPPSRSKKVMLSPPRDGLMRIRLVRHRRPSITAGGRRFHMCRPRPGPDFQFPVPLSFRLHAVRRPVSCEPAIGCSNLFPHHLCIYTSYSCLPA